MVPIQKNDTYKQIENKKSLGIKQKSVRMPKEQAQALAQKLKMATMAASIIAFGLFGGLIAPELQRSTTTTQTSSSSTKSSSVTGSQSTNGNIQMPSSSDFQSSSSSNQQQDGGYSFGSSGSSTAAGTGTHVS